MKQNLNPGISYTLLPVVELDPKQLIERVDATEAAIHGRLRDLQYDSDHHEERQLMADAQHALAVLRRCP
jgi:hypothetical protein